VDRAFSIPYDTNVIHFAGIIKHYTIRYDMIEEFNVDSKAEYTA